MSKEELAKEIVFRGIHYTLHGDYYFPDIIAPKDDPRPIGRWGRMHRRYLQEHRPVLYNQFVVKGKLGTYLADINEQAQDRLTVLIRNMKEIEGVDEKMKAQDQMRWVGRMNNIRQRAEESIMAEMILT